MKLLVSVETARRNYCKLAEAKGILKTFSFPSRPRKYLATNLFGFLFAVVFFLFHVS
jgi:hypothetical protein